MQVTTAMLADAARVESGKLYVHGGGWDAITVQSLPATQPTMALALVMQIDYDEALDDTPFAVELIDEDNRSTGVRIEGTVSVGHAPGSRPGTPSFVPNALTFNLLPFERAGGYRFRVTSGDREVASVPFRIVVRPA